MRISDWSSDVCSSDLTALGARRADRRHHIAGAVARGVSAPFNLDYLFSLCSHASHEECPPKRFSKSWPCSPTRRNMRSEKHTSELQSLMRISYAVFCLKKKKINTKIRKTHKQQT